MSQSRLSFLEFCASTVAEKRNQVRMLLWTLAWMAVWVLLVLASKRGWEPGTGGAIAAAMITVFFGLGMMRSFGRYLREADELNRKIELDSIAVAYGLGIVFSFAYWLLLRVGVLTEPDVLVIPVMMSFVHGFGTIVGKRRYR
jgi:hypothetical protein